jgi:hypothetical protein
MNLFNVGVESFTCENSLGGVSVSAFVRRPPEPVMKIRQYE